MAWPPGDRTPQQVAQEVTYSGHTIHKTYESPAGPPAHRADEAKCDQYASEAWPMLLDALRRAILTASVGAFRGRFPARAWVWINDVLHEARQNGWDSSCYHGFPLDDPRQYPLPASRLKDVPRVEIPTHRG